MAGAPEITIVGNVGADPEIRFTEQGVAIASFSVCVTDRYMKNGEWVDGNTSWWRCTVWRDPASNAVESLRRGMRVIVHGIVQQRQYEKDGVTRTSSEITVADVAPSLRFATAKVDKGDRTSVPVSQDPWERAAPRRPGQGGTNWDSADDPPF